MGSAIVRSNGIISVDSSGFTFNNGPGRGLSLSGIGSGAGYGGVGGASPVLQGGNAYGFATQPNEPGSGGGIGYPMVPAPSGSKGGGALRMIVKGVCVIDGTLSACGGDGLGDSWGGGSGGSIWLDASALTGKGVLRADGGRGELYFGGGGAGGRIAIYSPSDFFSGLVSVAGGAGYQYGQDGTIYRSATPLPLEVTSHSPAGTITQGVSSVLLQLNTPVDPSSLSSASAVVTTPMGVLAESNITVTAENPVSIRVSFPEQSAQGIYTVAFGPGVQNLHLQPMSQVYTGQFEVVWTTVEGYVKTPTGQPVSGVEVASPSGDLVITDASGHYVTRVPPVGTVQIVPLKQGLSFDPSQRTYDTVVSPRTEQNFVAVPSTILAPAFEVSNKMKLNWHGAIGLSYQALVSTNLIDWLPLGQPMQCTSEGESLLIEMPMDNSPGKFYRIQTLY
jgi:hypothetical protein